MKDNDRYIEHQFHPKPFWKTMSKCSECYKKHNEIVQRFKSKGRGFRNEETWGRELLTHI